MENEDSTDNQRYKKIEQVGNGAFGRVHKAEDRWTGEVVAVKELEFPSEYKRELEALSLLKHPNIVEFKDFQDHNGDRSFVFEFMDCDLRQLMTGANKPFCEPEIRRMCFQIFQGLTYMHDEHGYIHRDLKPENLLVDKRKDVIKIADFGVARPINDNNNNLDNQGLAHRPIDLGGGPNFSHAVGSYAYKSPELMLRSEKYDCKVDMWAMGAIMAEMFMMRPLFGSGDPGEGDEHQICRICRVMGSPTRVSWRESLVLAKKMKFEFPKYYSRVVDLHKLMPEASDSAVNLIASLCSWDPYKRPTAAEALRHPFFDIVVQPRQSTRRCRSAVSRFLHRCVASSKQKRS